MQTFFLLSYIALPLVTWWRSRSLAWTVIYIAGSVSIAGVAVNFVIDHVTALSWLGLQWLMAAALAAPAALAFAHAPRSDAPRRRQFVGIAVPVLLLVAFLFVMTTWWTEVPAYQSPVGFLMGNVTAEDNAEWLDFAALMATGAPIEQGVPLGGPLQLYLAAVGTAMAVASQALLGGLNEVMVAANTVVFGQFLLAALAPLALAPLAEASLSEHKRGSRRRRIPAPFIWTGQLVLVSALLVSITYGHLTWQFVAIMVTLWIAAFLVDSSVPKARLLTSLAVAAGMTVWVPLNVTAVVLLVGWLVVLLGRGIRGRTWDPLGIALVSLVAVGLWQPLRSSFAFVTDGALTAAGTGSGGVAAAVPLPAAAGALVDSTLLAAAGGVESVGPILASVAIAAAIGSAVLWDRVQPQGNYARFMPIGLLVGFLIALQVLDQWATGSAPNYGSTKFALLVVVAAAAVTVPVALMLISPHASGMTAARLVGVGAVVLALVLDSLLIKAVAVARPEQWSPPIPFNNPQSYWWPAEVNGNGQQPIARNPIGCVYLPVGAKAPSGILDSGLSDPQRVYSCTRLLAGLAGEDAAAQPMVDWLRREWLNNERAWEGVYGYLAGMPDSVLDRPVILLDDGSNVNGLESMRSLLERFPPDAWSQP